MQPQRFHGPNDPVPDLAIFIMRTDNGTHTGILHRMRGLLMIQHLVWHEMFRSEPYRGRFNFCVFALESDVEFDIRTMCRLIHDRHNSDPANIYRIPYAFRHGNNNRFNPATGELMLVDGIGLTCATFILTVFQSVGVSLVNFENWAVRDDDVPRFQALLQLMRDGIPPHIPAAPPEHVAEVERELPCIRVRPEETAATALMNALPSTFQDLAPGGAWILAHLPYGQ